MEKFKISFEKYKERLKKIFPKYSEEELKDFFIYKIEYLEMLVNKIIFEEI